MSKMLDGAYFHNRDALALQRRRDAAQRIDLRKLDRLQARHMARHAAVAALQHESNEAAAERAHQRRVIGYGSLKAEAFLARPLAEIAAASVEELEAAEIRDFEAFDAWVSATQRLASLQAHMQSAAVGFRQSCALMNRLEAFVQEQTR